MLSRRVPPPGGANAWSARLAGLRRTGATLLDLGESNPTRVGLEPAARGALAALTEASEYQPDPRGLEVAREAIAAYYAERGEAVAAPDVVLTTGTSEGYAHLFRLLADPGGRVVVPAPGYPLLEPLAAAEGVAVARYGLTYDRRWHLDLGTLEHELAAGARAVVLVEPNHPTGTCLTEEEWESVEAACARSGVPLIVDRVFADYAWDEVNPRFAGRAGERRTLTFTLSGISKICGLPQLKLGWIAVSGPEPARSRALAGLEWLSDLFLSVAGPVQSALPGLLAGCEVFQRSVRERVRGNLTRVDALVARNAELDRLNAEGGWACVLRLPQRRDDESWALELLDRAVVAHPGHFYDLALGACVVLSLIVTPRTMEEGLARLEAALEAP
jgi:aspartate/methionine/tyrosine aminotransferase